MEHLNFSEVGHNSGFNVLSVVRNNACDTRPLGGIVKGGSSVATATCFFHLIHLNHSELFTNPDRWKVSGLLSHGELMHSSPFGKQSSMGKSTSKGDAASL